MSKQAILTVDSVSAGYGPIQAVRNVSLKVFKGEIVAIIGANGAGKTSLMMCISGILPVSSGTILFMDHEIQRAKPHEIARAKLCQVPEGRKIFPRLSVEENLRMGAFTIRDKRRTAELMGEAYRVFPVLQERRNQLGGTLSGGEQQMLAIGRALMSEPKMLLLDEPSMGVAPILVERIFEALKKLNEAGLTILLVEQNAQLALTTSQRAYVLETGSVRLENQSAALLTDPVVKEAYLGRI